MKGKMIWFFLCLVLIGFNLQAQESILVGDVNGNGTVDIIDALEVALYYVNPDHVLANPGAADVNCSGGIDIIDALLIAQHYVGLIDNLPGCGIDSYPATYPRLSSDEIIVLQQEFQRINGSYFYGKVGPYGFLEYNYVPLEDVPPTTPLTDENEILQAARAAMIRNNRFTNVTTTTPLDVYRIIDRSVYWSVYYRFNSYKGLPAKEITMIVEGTQEAFCIEDYCYPDDIVIPATVNISAGEAMERCVGEIIVFYNFSGERVEYTVVAEDVTDEPTVKYVIPWDTGETLEFRYCWQVIIADGMWYMYIDVITGEVVDIEQNFQT